MARHVRLGEFFLGVRGLGILRHLLTGDDDTVQARVAEVRKMMAEFDEPPLALGVNVTETDLLAGYAVWAETFDTQDNPLHTVEEAITLSLLDELEPGRILDAACGTGRYAAALTSRHEVIGVDMSPHMLAKAREKLHGLPVLRGDLGTLPFTDGFFDAAICANALTHCDALGPPTAELARVVRPGGRVIVCDPHPMLVSLGGQPVVQTGDGNFGIIRDRPHLHGAYLAAFAEAGLTVRACHEPVYGPEHVGHEGFLAMIPDAAHAAYVGIPASLVWDLERI